MYEGVGVLCKALAVVSVLSSMFIGVEWDFQSMILLCFIHNLAGLAFDHTKHYRLCEHVSGLSLSECISLGVKLNRPRSHLRWSMTRNSIVDLVMHWSSNIYITAGFFCVWISLGEPYKFKTVGLVVKSHTSGSAVEHIWWLTEVLTVIIHLSCPAVRVPVWLSLSLSQRTRSLMVFPP